MYYQTLVKNLFNDMYHFLNGTQAIGLEDLRDNYQEEPLFLAFIGDLDKAAVVNYNDAMKECYAFYKKFCGRELAEEEWDLVIPEIEKFNGKWENTWCKGLILALLDILDKEDREQRAAREKTENGNTGEEFADSGLGQEETELEQGDGQQEMKTAA